MKLEISNKTQTGKLTKVWKLNNTFKQWIKEKDNPREIFKILRHK